MNLQLGPGMALSAFNSVMDEFLKQLAQIIPQAADVHKFFLRLTSEHASDEDRRVPCQMFMTGVQPYIDQIRAHDNRFIMESCKKIELLKGAHLDRYWNDPKKFAPEHQEAMWKFLDHMVFMGSIIMTVPSEMMQAAERMTSQLFGMSVPSSSPPFPPIDEGD